MTGRPVLLTPQREETGIYPYRRVWRTASLEAGLLLVLCIGILLALRFLPIQFDGTSRQAVAIAFALTPLALWWGISYQAERRALQRRERLWSVVLLGGLAASGVALPLIHRLFDVTAWLTNADGLSRLVGYMLTVGMIQEFLKYAAMRYSIWPEMFRRRIDGVAYALATGIGYATALNLDYVLSVESDLSSVALRVTEITLGQVSLSTIMGLCLSELARPNVPVFVVPLGLGLAAAMASFAIVFRGGLIVGNVGPDSTASTAVQGLGMAVFLVIMLFSSVGFLIHSADEREALRRRPE